MDQSIIFISGWGVPKFLQKGPLVWNDENWINYNRIYLQSKIPTSDFMVQKHLLELNDFVNSFSKPIVIAQSLGAWWAANLACQSDCKINKLVLMTPLAHLIDYPFFNATPLYYPFNRAPIITGPHKVLVCGGVKDLIAPCRDHSERLIKHFNGIRYSLNGGHYLQKDHKSCLKFAKDWIEIE